MPKQHPRTEIVDQAGLDLRESLQSIRAGYELTKTEYMAMVVSVLSDALSSALKYELRFERHGCYDKPADRE